MNLQTVQKSYEKTKLMGCVKAVEPSPLAWVLCILWTFMSTRYTNLDRSSDLRRIQVRHLPLPRDFYEVWMQETVKGYARDGPAAALVARRPVYPLELQGRQGVYSGVRSLHIQPYHVTKCGVGNAGP